MNLNNLTFKLFTLAIFIALILPVLLQDGMFMDGMLYTCVAHNLSNGIGTFWNPVFSETYFTSSQSSFHEHPPLVFGIQALFFKILGDSLYVERFYSFLTACISAFLIMQIWKLINFANTEFRLLSWLPVLLWIIIPVCFWAFQNNMQENTMGIFILLSVIFSLKVLLLNHKTFLNLFLSGLFIFFASLSKGVPGFFPLIIYLLFFITHPKKITFNKMLVYTSITLLVAVILYALLMLWPEARESLIFYTRERLIGRVATTPTVDNRFSILGQLFMQLIPAIVILLLLIALFAYKRIPIKLKGNNSKMSLFLILIGLSGSVPLMITMVQKAFYFTPSLPFFALAFALILAPGLHVLLKKYTNNKSFANYGIWISGILVALSVVFSVMQIGKTSRNKEMLHDVYQIGKIVPSNSTINIDNSMWNEWDLQCYLIRYYYISLDPNELTRNYVLLNKNLQMNSIAGYKTVNGGLEEYNLFEKIKE